MSTRTLARVDDVRREHRELATSEIRTAARLPRQRVRLALHELRRLGLIRRGGTCHYVGGRGSERFWSRERASRLNPRRVT